MNFISIIAFLYFLLGNKNSDLLKNINLENILPILNIFGGEKFNLNNILNSDLLKNLNIDLSNLEKYAPYFELFKNLSGFNLENLNENFNKVNDSTVNKNNNIFNNTENLKIEINPVCDKLYKGVNYSIKQT